MVVKVKGKIRILPCIFTDEGIDYLFYSCAGESGIAGARIDR